MLGHGQKVWLYFLLRESTFCCLCSGVWPPPPVLVFIDCLHCWAGGSWLLSNTSYITASVNHPGMFQVRKIQTLTSPLKAPIPGLRSHCSLWYLLSLTPQVFSKGLLLTCGGMSCPGAAPTHGVPPEAQPDTASGVERSRVGVGRADECCTGPSVPYFDDSPSPTNWTHILISTPGLFELSAGTSLAVQWLRLCASSAGLWVPSFVRELSSHMLHGQ